MINNSNNNSINNINETNDDNNKKNDFRQLIGKYIFKTIFFEHKKIAQHFLKIWDL